MIKLFAVNMPRSTDAPLLETLHSGYIAQGQKVEEFEQKFADGFGFDKDQCVSVNSGTSALTLALRLCDVKGPSYDSAGEDYEYSEVITTAMTCTATNLPILSLDAQPIFADIDEETGLIDPTDVAVKVKYDTHAIMATDWGGAPVDVKYLKEVVKNVPVIVDAAHALGAEHNEQPDFLCYSFQAIKHLTTGDGGMLVCKNPEDAIRAKRLRWFGIDRTGIGLESRIDQDITEWGYKFHMNDLAAVIGIASLDSIHNILQAHKLNATYYDDNLSDYFIKPPLEGSNWLYTILLPDKHQRDLFKDYMLKNGVEVSQVHKRNDMYSVFSPYRQVMSPGLDTFSDRMICIPVHWGLAEEELEHIVDLCNKFAEDWS